MANRIQLISRLSAMFLGAVVALGATSLNAAEDDPVVARVNGHDIFLSEVMDARNLLPAALRDASFAEVSPLLIDTLIDARLAAERARKQGLNTSPQYKKTLLRIQEQVLQRLLFTSEIEKQITEQKIKERYDQLVDNFPEGDEVHARHILLESEAKAKEVIAKLGDGTDFKELAQEHSIGPSASTGGDLGWFSQGRMVPAFDAVVFDLDVGAHTQAPVKTRFGWHVIRVEGRRKAQTPTLEQAREEVVRQLSTEIGQQLMGEMRKKAKIERFQIEAKP